VRPRGAGSKLGPGYTVVEHLARGRTLDAYHAWSEERHSACVVKVLRPDRRDEPGPRRRLVAEGRALTRLSHPNIVRGYEVVREPHPLVAMESIGGETVGRLVERRGWLAPKELAFLGLHLCSAMRYLHERDLVHLDLKPSNVIADGGRAKVIDLSLTRRPGRARPGRGTWCYMAPEQARGGQVGPAADVWGVGVVLYEGAAGDTPFGDESLLYPQLEGRAPSLRSERRGLPRSLTTIVDATLDPSPEYRPTVAEVATALEPVAGARY